MSRWLFQRFEERVERRLGELMHFVDNVNLVARARGHHADIFADLPHVFHAVIRCAVDFDHVNIIAGGDGQAIGAGPARVGCGTVDRRAIESLGQNPRRSGFAYPARSDEQESVRDTSRADGVLQGASNVFLADHFVERLGPPLAGKHQIVSVSHCSNVRQPLHPRSRPDGRSATVPIR